MAEKKQTLEASEFTVDAMEAEIEAEEMEQMESKSAQKAEASRAREQSKKRDKMIEQMMKPPPAKVIVEKMRQEERRAKESEAVERKRVFDIVNSYMMRFPWLAQKIPPLKSSSSLAEAEEVLRLIRETMNASGSLRTVAEYFNMGFTWLEGLFSTPSFREKLPEAARLNLKDFAFLFREGKFDELDSIIVEIDIEYPWLGRRPLLWRLAQTVQNLMLKVNAYNTNPAARKIFEMSKAAPVKISGAEDL